MPARGQVLGELLGGREDRLVLAGRDEVHVGGRDVARPAQADLVEGVLGDRGDGARGTDAVGAHGDGDELAVLVEHLEVERVGVLAAELEDVAHLDAARGLQGAAVARCGQGSPSRTSATSMTPSPEKSRPATRSSTWLPATSAPVTQRGALDDAGVEQEADAGGLLLAEGAGADVALGQRRPRGEVGLAERLEHHALAELGLEPLGVDLAVAGQADRERLGRCRRGGAPRTRRS